MLGLCRRPAISRQIQRLFQERVEAAIGLLRASADESGESIHEIRKHGKRLRALVVLVRTALPQRGKAFDRGLRDVNRRLAERRDAMALCESFAWLAAQEGDAHPRSFTVVAAALEARAAAMDRRALDLKPLEKQLTRLARQFGDVQWSNDGWPLLAENLRRCYRSGRRLARHLNHESSGDAAHELRKLAKQTLYHLEFLRNLSPHRLGGEHAAFEQLTEVLGRHHDLTLLAGLLPRLQSAEIRGKDRHRVEQRLVRRMSQLAAKARKLAARVYAERPTTWIERLTAYWQAWQLTPRRRTSTKRTAAGPRNR